MHSREHDSISYQKYCGMDFSGAMTEDELEGTARELGKKWAERWRKAKSMRKAAANFESLDQINKVDKLKK